MFGAPPPPAARVEAKATSAPSALHDGSTAAVVSTTSAAGAPPPSVRINRPACPFAVETNTSRSPEGDQLGLASIDPANPNPAVRGSGLVPSAAHSHSLGTPLSSLKYAMCRASGESAGWVTFGARGVRRRSTPPVEGTAYSSAWPSGQLVD